MVPGRKSRDDGGGGLLIGFPGRRRLKGIGRPNRGREEKREEGGSVGGSRDPVSGLDDRVGVLRRLVTGPAGAPSLFSLPPSSSDGDFRNRDVFWSHTSRSLPPPPRDPCDVSRDSTPPSTTVPTVLRLSVDPPPSSFSLFPPTSPTPPSLPSVQGCPSRPTDGDG